MLAEHRGGSGLLELLRRMERRSGCGCCGQPVGAIPIPRSDGGVHQSRRRGVILCGPPLIGFTPPRQTGPDGRSRDVVSDRVRSVARKVPGILGASVSRDPEHADRVHDIRLFANHARVRKARGQIRRRAHVRDGRLVCELRHEPSIHRRDLRTRPQRRAPAQKLVAATLAPPIGLASFRLGAPEMLASPIPTGSHRGA